ncbi:hypothetical protein AXF42_Ash017848 [Apostasia shenzhenica]|uniref:Uncharacterized protein n=1 Tax=Apostasia shenzhenica TaxID=1088818 RepID=A0A2I0A3Y9_9ASPA|nr:hypothetical protein AXF42_Ash017848 [Apostasia shenzhenica]
MASGSSPATPTPDSLPYVMRLSDSLCFEQYTASLKCILFSSSPPFFFCRMAAIVFCSIRHIIIPKSDLNMLFS